MRKRTDLHEKLCEILGSRNVYFEPPENVKLKYPCIVYTFDGLHQIKADNKNYRTMGRYGITVISTKIGVLMSPIAEKILELSYANYGRHFDADGLAHDTLDIFF